MGNQSKQLCESIALRGVLGYSPLPSQKLFHASNARFKGFSGPIGSGKSAALCHEALRLAKMNAGRTGLLGAPTYGMLWSATQFALQEALEVSQLPYHMNKSEQSVLIEPTKSTILLRSMDQFERLRGTNLAWFGLDELTYTSEEAWLRLEGRLRDPKAKRLEGFAVWTPKGYDWVHTRFTRRGTSYEVVQAQPFENKHILEHVPDFYERLRQSYDKDFYEQEVLGRYLNVNGGQVYRAFSREANLQTRRPVPQLPLMWALDFNVNPMCSVIVQQEGSTIYVLDEIVLNRASTQDACLEFSKRYPYVGSELLIYGDASGNNWSTKGSSDFEIVKEFFRRNSNYRCRFDVPRSNPAVRDRVGLVNAKLQNADGDVELFIDPRCKELILDLEQVTYMEGRPEIDKNRDKARTHLSDALGYVIWERCKQPRQAGHQERRIL